MSDNATYIGPDGTVWVWDARTGQWVKQQDQTGWSRSYMER